MRNRNTQKTTPKSTENENKKAGVEEREIQKRKKREEGRAAGR
jgi:hypothetical protein